MAPIWPVLSLLLLPVQAHSALPGLFTNSTQPLETTAGTSQGDPKLVLYAISIAQALPQSFAVTVPAMQDDFDQDPSPSTNADTTVLVGELAAILDELDLENLSASTADLAAAVMEDWLEKYDLATEEEEDDEGPPFKKLKLTE